MQSPSRLSSLVRRCIKPIFGDRSTSVLALEAMLLARPLFDPSADKDTVRTLHSAFLRLCRVDCTMIADALQNAAIDPAAPNDGRSVAMLAACLPKTDCDEVVWQSVVKLATAGLSAATWAASDVRSALTHISYWGAYPPSLPLAIDRYVSTRCSYASPYDVANMIAVLCNFPEIAHSPMIDAAIRRAIVLGETLPPAVLGSITGSLGKVNHKSYELLAVLEDQAIRFAEECDAISATSFLLYVMAHDDASKTFNPDAVKCVMERLLLAKDELDAECLMLLFKALRSTPKTLKPLVERETADLVGFVSGEATRLVNEDYESGGLRGASPALQQLFISRYFSLIIVMPKQIALPAEVDTAIAALCGLLTAHAEEIVGDDNPPQVITQLFELERTVATETALVLLREAAAQNTNFPTVMTFRLLLAMGDRSLFDEKVMRHLRRQFALTVKGIPMIQLCVALKCIVRGEEAAHGTSTTLEDGRLQTEAELAAEVDREMDKELRQQFIQQCHEVISAGFGGGLDMRCGLSLTESMFRLKHVDEEFFDQAAAFLSSKVAGATPSVHYGPCAANVCLALGEDRLEKHAKLHTFLLEVGTHGLKDETPLPTRWMNENDPANMILPLTVEQQHCWSIMEQMKNTRGADTDRLAKLSAEFVSLLPHCRVDDLRYFFAIFADKVYKNDRDLKECMDHLLKSGTVIKLSMGSLAAMLHSLAAIRFTFYGTAKNLLLNISEEQWSSLDAAVLVNIVAGMAKLTLRIPAVFSHISERLALVYKLLSPLDTAVLINSLQSLGFHDDVVMSMLMQHAAANARRYDEVALTMLFGSSSVHRLLKAQEVALPLLDRASTCSMSAPTKAKLVQALRKSDLPRDVIKSAVLRIAPSAPAAGALQLES
jgi:hypothetical protein